MKNKLFYIVTGCLLIMLSACYKDKGNYSYTDPGEPVLTNFDSVYTAVSGDSLIITPTIKLAGGRTDYTLYWEIQVPEKATGLNFTGNSLRMLFNLNAQRYQCQLTVADNKLGLNYFYTFFISGQTQFTTGTLVLSDQGGAGKLSFINAKDSVLSNIYEGINGATLGNNPLQLIYLRNMNYLNVLSSYWVICGDPQNPGVQLDASSLQATKTLRDNFFDAPSIIQPNYFVQMHNGTTTAIVNNSLYVGVTSTAPFSTVYGSFGTTLGTISTLAPDITTSTTTGAGGVWYLGFDNARKCIQRFSSVSYLDTVYTQVDSFYNTKNLKMDLIKIVNIDDNDIFMICDSAGVKYELKMGVDFLTGGSSITEYSKKVFPGAAMLTSDTKWASSQTGIIYFSSADKIYRYNPLNGDLRTLTADLGGKAISMLKTSDDFNELYVGVDGSLYTLDISVGKFGNILKEIDGIPGKVIDQVIR